MMFGKLMSKRQLLILVLGVTMLLMAACAPSAERLNNQGNDEFAREAFDEAMVQYQKAQIENPELAEPYYNAANSLYRRGAYEEALEQLQVALSFAEEETLAQNGFFNLGNTLFNGQRLDAAVDAFKQALLLNPDDADAKYNLELALRTQEEQEQQQEQEQEQEQQEQDQQEQDQQDEGENGDEQEQQSQDQQSGEEGEDGEEQQKDDAQQGDQGGDQEESEEEGQNGSGNGEPTEEESTGQSQTPTGDQRMTPEQAQQLLEAIAREGETLQERLGRILRGGSNIPPVQDW